MLVSKIVISLLLTFNFSGATTTSNDHPVINNRPVTTTVQTPNPETSSDKTEQKDSSDKDSDDEVVIEIVNYPGQ